MKKIISIFTFSFLLTSFSFAAQISFQGTECDQSCSPVLCQDVRNEDNQDKKDYIEVEVNNFSDVKSVLREIEEGLRALKVLPGATVKIHLFGKNERKDNKNQLNDDSVFKVENFKKFVRENNITTMADWHNALGWSNLV